MTELNIPDMGKEPKLSLENLVFHSGHKEFTKEEFIKVIAPYFDSMKSYGRTNFLCAFEYGNGDKAEVTAYKTDTTIDVTNNSRVLKCMRTKGKWVVYKLNS